MDNAIEMMKVVLEKTPSKFRRRRFYLAIMAEKLRMRSVMLWEQGLSNFQKDLEDASKYALEACSRSQEGSTDAHFALLALARCYFDRFQQSPTPDSTCIDQT